MDNELKVLSDQIYDLTGELVESGSSPLAIAALYTTIAMQIYKTVLSEQDYHLMVDTLSDSRDKVIALTDIGRTLN